VLLVDDEEFNNYALKLMLKGHNINSDITNSVQSAVQLVKERIEMAKSDPMILMYELIFLNYSLKDSDGSNQGATEIKKLLVKEGLKVPFICCCSTDID